MKCGRGCGFENAHAHQLRMSNVHKSCECEHLHRYPRGIIGRARSEQRQDRLPCWVKHMSLVMRPHVSWCDAGFIQGNIVSRARNSKQDYNHNHASLTAAPPPPPPAPFSMYVYVVCIVYVCMYVCMSVCLYVSMFVCMYVCMCLSCIYHLSRVRQCVHTRARKGCS